jgi:succinate dehydrogenase hydrophobic anchor subunit
MLTPNSTFRDVVDLFISLINFVIPVLVALALVLFLWGGVRYIYKASDAHGKGADKEVLLWGVIALFVLVSVWGILRILREALLG